MSKDKNYHILTFAGTDAPEVKNRNIRGMDRAVEFAKHYTQLSTDDSIVNNIKMAMVIDTDRNGYQDDEGSFIPSASALVATVIRGEVVGEVKKRAKREKAK